MGTVEWNIPAENNRGGRGDDHSHLNKAGVTVVGWLVDVIYADPSLESDMQHTTTIYIRVHTCRVLHFLKKRT